MASTWQLDKLKYCTTFVDCTGSCRARRSARVSGSDDIRVLCLMFHTCNVVWLCWLKHNITQTHYMQSAFSVVLYNIKYTRTCRSFWRKCIALHCTPVTAISSWHLWSANQHQLIVPCCWRITFGRWAFSVAGPTVWNSLPTEFRGVSVGFGDFRHTLKTILFARY